MVNSAIEIGVVGYVLKDDYVSDLPDALQAASVGERFISPSLLAIVQKRDGHVEYPKSKSKGLDGLTPSQLRIPMDSDTHSDSISDSDSDSIRTLLRSGATLSVDW